MLSAFCPIGVIFVLTSSLFPRNPNYGGRALARRLAQALKRRRRIDGRVPFRSPLLGWFLKALAVGWLCFCYFWVEGQWWFQRLADEVKGQAAAGLYPLLYMPGLSLLYSGYKLSQRISP